VLEFVASAVRSCVLIKLRPKKKLFPVRFVWACSQKGLRSRKKKGERGSEKNRTPSDPGEALVTNCPFEAVGDFFLPGLN
jgi:ribosomal protein L40E